MIPDEIKARFVHEYIKSSNLEAVRREIAAGLRGPAGPPPDFRVHMIAALEVVAARIWADAKACALREAAASIEQVDGRKDDAVANWLRARADVVEREAS